MNCEWLSAIHDFNRPALPEVSDSPPVASAGAAEHRRFWEGRGRARVSARLVKRLAINRRHWRPSGREL